MNEHRASDILARWDRHSRFLLVVAALLPLAPVGENTPRSVAIVVGLACWSVFVFDLTLRTIATRGYLRTGWGVFDLAIVILTFPFAAVFGIAGGEVTSLLRLARVVRVVVVGAHARQLFARVNKLVAYVVLVLVVGSLIVLRAEDGRAGFENFGDALWFSIVTMTTVGYGNLVPESGLGQITASAMMIFGIGLIGAVASMLTSFLGVEPSPTTSPDGAAGEDADLHDAVAELQQARAELEAAAARAATLLGTRPAGGND